jgi:hypothetical protein
MSACECFVLQKKVLEKIITRILTRIMVQGGYPAEQAVFAG